MNVSLPDRKNTKTFVSNPGCTVELMADGRLHCITSGKLLTGSLFVLGMLLIYGSIFIIGWDLPRGRIHSNSLLSGAAVFLAGIFLQWRCMRRQKEMGVYEIDTATRRFTKSGRERVLPFETVSKLRLAINMAAVFNWRYFPRLPYWLFIHFQDGRQIRIAMGKRAELIPLLDWLKASGVPPNGYDLV